MLIAAYPDREWGRHAQNARLSERGWVLQERLLSPRTVHIGKREVFRECNSHRGGETTADYHVLSNDFKGYFTDLGLCDQGRAANQFARAGHWRCGTGRQHVTPYRAWNMLIQAYSRMELSKPSDKLIAIAGIASRMARFLSLPPTSYLAGLWKEELPQNLL